MRWLWIDRVVELVPREKLVAVKGISLAEEHLHDHFAAEGDLAPLPVMPASLIVAGMAQSAGILVGHAGDFQEKVLLAKVSRAEITADPVPGYTLRHTATLTHYDAAGASCKGVVELIDPAEPSANPTPIAEIDMMFAHADNNMSGIELPEGNFVFSESFRTLLRSSGIAADF